MAGNIGTERAAHNHYFANLEMIDHSHEVLNDSLLWSALLIVAFPRHAIAKQVRSYSPGIRSNLFEVPQPGICAHTNAVQEENPIVSLPVMKVTRRYSGDIF